MKKWNELNPQEKKVLVRFYKDEAFKDNDWNIRISAYRSLGFTEEALRDDSWLIRDEAIIYLNHMKTKKVTI